MAILQRAARSLLAHLDERFAEVARRQDEAAAELAALGRQVAELQQLARDVNHKTEVLGELGHRVTTLDALAHRLPALDDLAGRVELLDALAQRLIGVEEQLGRLVQSVVVLDAFDPGALTAAATQVAHEVRADVDTLSALAASVSDLVVEARAVLATARGDGPAGR